MEGRFLSKDPLSFDGGDVNLYGYVSNNPVNYTDPTGLLARCTSGLDALGGNSIGPLSLSPGQRVLDRLGGPP